MDAQLDSGIAEGGNDILDLPVTRIVTSVVGPRAAAFPVDSRIESTRLCQRNYFMQEQLIGGLAAGEKRFQVPECGCWRMPPYHVGQRSMRLERATQLIYVVANFHAEDGFFG